MVKRAKPNDIYPTISTCKVTSNIWDIGMNTVDRMMEMVVDKKMYKLKQQYFKGETNYVNKVHYYVLGIPV